MLKRPLFGSVFFGGIPDWTDGKPEPVRQWFQNLYKCPHCLRLFWTSQTKEIGRTSIEEEESGAYSRARYMEFPGEDDLYALLCGRQKDPAQERNLRLLAWQRSNDKWRETTSAPMISERVRQNMLALSDMLDEQNQADRLMKAEIARELGDFAGAKRLLAISFDAEHAEKAVFLRKLVRGRNIKVARYPSKR